MNYLYIYFVFYLALLLYAEFYSETSLSLCDLSALLKCLKRLELDHTCHSPHECVSL